MCASIKCNIYAIVTPLPLLDFCLHIKTHLFTNISGLFDKLDHLNSTQPRSQTSATVFYSLSHKIFLHFFSGPDDGMSFAGEYKKDELLEAARSGNDVKLMSLLTPLNVNCHASDGRKSTPLHLAAGYNRTSIVQLLLQQGADVHAKDKG